MMFHLVPALIGIYVAARIAPALSAGTLWKWVTAIAIILISQYHLIKLTLLPGTMASPEVPFPVLAVGGWLSGSFLVVTVLMVLRDIAIILLWAGRKTGLLPDSMVMPNSWAIYLAIASLILAAIGVREAVKVPDIKRVEVTLPKLPPEMDGFKLVQLTDLHASRLLQRDWIENVVKKTNALNPDLIVVTGDLVDGTVENRANDVAPYRDLKARLGVYAVTGNHEYYSNYIKWMDAFGKLGLSILKNEHTVIDDNGHRLVLAGVTDRVAERFGLPLPDISKALDGAPKNLPIILLAHQPKGSAAYAEAGADLQLSGHTHGGQIFGIHWIVQAANEGFVSGLYRVGNMQLYVSRGTGLWNGLPIRIGCPSEITEFILHSPQTAFTEPFSRNRTSRSRSRSAENR